MTTNPSLAKRLPGFVTRSRVPACTSLACAAILLLVGCGDEAFCESICSELSGCLDRVEFEECRVACEDELDVAMEIGGDECVSAREYYLDCAVEDLCLELGFENSCRPDAVEGEIESCGESLGEF